MAIDCSKYTCQVDTAKFVTSDRRIYKATHGWKLAFSFDGVGLCDIKRAFNINTTFNQAFTASKYVPTGEGGYFTCDKTSTGFTTNAFTESLTGYVCQIMYADFENSVYLLRKHREVVTSTCTYQNPFHYMDPYGGVDSVAYFPKLTKTTTVTFELWIGGELKTTATDKPVTEVIKPQPLVWPNPSSQASFFLAAKDYEWMNDSFFYWYNDPFDIGWPPCLDGPSPSAGLTGYEKAYADGGKDFFYAPWIRENCFVGVPIFHSLLKREAEIRFRAIFGGPHKEECAEPFSEKMNIDLWISQDIVGNYIKYADMDFYSFYLPEIKTAINNVGNAELTTKFLTAVEGADVCFPICLL